MDYQLEDHLSLLKKTPKSDETSENGDGQEHGGRFESDLGVRDTLTAEIPKVSEDGVDDEVQTNQSDVFSSFLVHGAPLSPVVEIDENERRSRQTTRTTSERLNLSNHSFPVTQATATPTPTPTEDPRHSSTSPIHEKIEAQSTEDRCRARTTENKSAAQTKVQDMMDIDEGTETKALTEQQTPQRQRQSPDSTHTEKPIIKSPSTQRRSKVQHNTHRSPQSTNRRPPIRLQAFQEEVLEKLKSEPGTWMFDVYLYLMPRWRELDCASLQQVKACVEKLLSDPGDGNSWLSFLHLDLHKSAEIDYTCALEQGLRFQNAIPSIKSLYLIAMLEAGDDRSNSYQRLMHDYLQLSRNDDEFLATMIQTLGLLPDESKETDYQPRHNYADDFSTLEEMEEQLLQLIDRRL